MSDLAALEGELKGLEDALADCVKTISPDASRKALYVATDELARIYGRSEQLTIEIDEAEGDRKALLARCEALADACEKAKDETWRETVAAAADARRAAGNAHYAEGRHAEARAEYTLALELTPEDPRLLLNRGLCAQSLKDWTAAAADARQAASLDVNSAKAWLHLVRSLVALGDVAGAAAALGNAPEAVKAKSKGLTDLEATVVPESAKKAANAFFVRKEYDKAIPLYGLAVDLTKGSKPVYLSNRSACYQALKRWDRASEDARRCVAADASFAKGHLHLARCLKALGRADEAAEALQKGLKVVEDPAPLEALLKELAAPAPPPPQLRAATALREAAGNLYKRQRYKEALTEYTKCLGVCEVERDAVLGNRAACWMMVDEPARAAEDCAKAEAEIAAALPGADGREADRLKTSRGKIAKRRGDALTRLGRLAEAKEVLDAAAEATGDTSLEKRAGDVAEALELQQTADEALERKEYSRAKRCLVRLREDQKVTDDASLRAKLAKCHYHCKEYEDGSREALAALSSKRLGGQELVDAHLTRADSLLASGDRERAAQHCRACLQLDPDDAAVKQKLKRLRAATKDAERIKADVERLVKARDYEAAARAASEGVAVDPDDKKLLSAMHVRRAKCYQLLALQSSRGPAEDADERRKRCEQHWRRCHADASAALYHAEGSRSAYLLGAEALQGLKRYSDALSLLEQMLETLPDAKGDRELVGKYKQAQRLLKKASRPDLYKVVGPDLDETADEDALKKAYKKAAMKWHPDRFSAKGEKAQQEAAEKFKEVNDAYEFLTDPQRRRLWDQGYDREEVEQQLEMQKQQSQCRGGFPGGGGFHGFPAGFRPG
mmetsp:Transcript_7201/g.21238  ORF Transcript_7201/g.21238 Transcript_7201/m.21238 type:complete len:845 (-) Transcript_7201:87-2621(-)